MGKPAKIDSPISIDSMSHDGRGVGRNADGKVVFVDYALPGEVVEYRVSRSRRNHVNAVATEIIDPSPQRVNPPCPVFGICGGCLLQHMDHDAQLQNKQRQLLENLEKIGNVVPGEVMPPVTGDTWHYRRRARLGVRDVAKKGGILVGFRERNKSYVTPITECAVLHDSISDLLVPLQEAISQLSCRNRVPQVEAAAGDNGAALVFRHLEELNDRDLEILKGLAVEHGVQVFLQPGNLDSVHPLSPEDPEPLYYELESWGQRIFFEPTDFIQVNGDINSQLVDHVIELLDPRPDDVVLDLFCGLGNFSLPLATRAGQVIAIEGDEGLVRRGRRNAEFNGRGNIEFLSRDLFDEEDTAWLPQAADRMLIDPPRSGAIHVVKQLQHLRPERLVYVSCNPATLARDAGVLCHNQGYRLAMAGIVDMFPHTAHVESIAVFELDTGD